MFGKFPKFQMQRFHTHTRARSHSKKVENQMDTLVNVIYLGDFLRSNFVFVKGYQIIWNWKMRMGLGSVAGNEVCSMLSDSHFLLPVPLLIRIMLLRRKMTRLRYTILFSLSKTCSRPYVESWNSRSALNPVCHLHFCDKITMFTDALCLSLFLRTTFDLVHRTPVIPKCWRYCFNAYDTYTDPIVHITNREHTYCRYQT